MPARPTLPEEPAGRASPLFTLHSSRPRTASRSTPRFAVTASKSHVCCPSPRRSGEKVPKADEGLS